MIRLFLTCRPLLLATATIVLSAAGVEAAGFVYKPARRDSNKLHLTTDFAGYYRLTGSTDHSDALYSGSERRFMLSMDLGIYKNLDQRQGFGGGLFVATTTDSYRYGLRGRYRRWLSRYGRLDFSPGIIVGGEINTVDIEFPGFSGTVSFSPVGWCSIITAVEVTRLKIQRFSGNQTQVEKWNAATVYGGLRLESYAGMIGLGATVIAAAVFVIVLLSSWED